MNDKLHETALTSNGNTDAAGNELLNNEMALLTSSL
jgi:hypothetical protein